MIAQIRTDGLFAIIEQRTEFTETLKKFAGTEVEIKITEVNEFTTLLQESISLQNRFSEMTNESEKRWTNEDFTVLRSKMSGAYFRLIDDFATAKSDEKSATVEKEICLEKLRAGFINDFSPSVATTKAKATEEYQESARVYVEAYKIRSLMELHLKSLDLAMNSIAGIQKHDVNKLKF